jgi:hypothetical protein
MSLPALVVEDRRGTKALSRSWALVDGHWWHTFGTIFLTGLLIRWVNIAINVTVGRFIENGWFAQTIVQATSIALTTPLVALVGVLLYLELRARKEDVYLDTFRAELQSVGRSVADKRNRARAGCTFGHCGVGGSSVCPSTWRAACRWTVHAYRTCMRTAQLNLDSYPIV